MLYVLQVYLLILANLFFKHVQGLYSPYVFIKNLVGLP